MPRPIGARWTRSDDPAGHSPPIRPSPGPSPPSTATSRRPASSHGGHADGSRDRPELRPAVRRPVLDLGGPEAYQAARAGVGRDPDAQVRLALWCEAHGLEAERIKHLSLAALADPTHAPARALMGLVSEGGRWGRPEAIAARLKADPTTSALRTEYEARRDRAEFTADDQWKSSPDGARRTGLAVRGDRAHDTAVTRIDPRREAAWKKLGCKKFDGRWMTPEKEAVGDPRRPRGPGEGRPALAPPPGEVRRRA